MSNPHGMTADKFELLVNLLSQGVAQEAIAAAVGVSASRVSQMIDSEEVKVALEARLATMHVEQQEFNQGWDAIEKLSLTNVIESLSHNKDPEFSLRAAVLANKAARRGLHGRQGIVPQPAGSRMVINLNVGFVQKLESGAKQIQASIAHPPAKVDSLLTPKRVESALGLIDAEPLVVS